MSFAVRDTPSINRPRFPPLSEIRHNDSLALPLVPVETKEGYILEAEMPGVSKGGLEITLEGNELTISGRRDVPPIDGEALYRESRALDLRRVFELDPAIDTAKISAKMDQGVLILELPKAERVKPRRISIGDW